MKIKLQIIFLSIAIIFVSSLNIYAAPDDIVYIPDTNFKAFLVTNYDGNSDGEIQESEVSWRTDLSVNSQNIADLTGIKSFTSLSNLHCRLNQLMTLDVSGCTNLITLNCSNNQLTTLDVSGCTNLAYLYCEVNQLTTLDVSTNTNLVLLDCDGNQLTGLDVSTNTNLDMLNCVLNQLTGLDVSTNTNLYHLECYSNQLTTLDVCISNRLWILRCYSNQLTTLDVSGCTNLTELDCYSNQLTTLGVSGCTNLTRLWCRSNQLTTLDVSGCTNLTDLWCQINQLTNIPDVTSCSSLNNFFCNYNYFDVDDCPDIFAIESMGMNFLYNPQYDDSTLDCSCIGSLPDTGQYLCYNNNDNETIENPAPGAAFYGQDAQYIKSRSYTKLGLNGIELDESATDWLMVKDNVADLIWEVKHPGASGANPLTDPNDADNIYSWYDGTTGAQGNGTTTFDTQAFINDLNTAIYGGYSDWRMPTSKELTTITAWDSTTDPMVELGFFPATATGGYWTATPIGSSSAWRIYPSSSFLLYYDFRTTNLHARAVRTGATESECDLIDNANGTVTDPNTGLMWQQAQSVPATMDWSAALDYCLNQNNSSYLGYNDWRLPDIIELQSLADYSMRDPAIDPLFTATTANSNYWTSTTNYDWNSCVWIVNFSTGFIQHTYASTTKAGDLNVRLVRTVDYGYGTAGDIAVTPASLDFGYVETGTSSAAQYVTISNNGDADLVIGELEISGTWMTQYSIDIDGSHVTLTPGTSVQAGIIFSPLASGAIDANLEIPSNDGDTVVFTVTLQGSACTDQTWYRDADSDGYGDPSVSQINCGQPTGYVADNTDDDDSDPTVYPGATEYCDGKDNDQDGATDEDCILLLLGHLPDTGQYLCYNNDDHPIAPPASGTEFYGQDAQFIKQRSYTKLELNGVELAESATDWLMVKDNVTGLIWEVKHAGDDTADFGNFNDADNIYTWYDGSSGTQSVNDTQDFLAGLNAINYGGFNDWRLPTVKELAQLISHGRRFYPDAIDTNFFPETISFGSSYWSATPNVNSDYAWIVSFPLFNNPEFIPRFCSTSFHVRAVRAGESEPSLHMFDNGDGTVSDNYTGLMWQQTDSASTMSWQAALAYCKTQNELGGTGYAGYSDWRLPDIYELQSMFDYSEENPAIYKEWDDSELFTVTDTTNGFYWSSTTGQFYVASAQTTAAQNGSSYLAGKINPYYVRLVRGGEIGREGVAEITVIPDSITFDGDYQGEILDETILVTNTGVGGLIIGDTTIDGVGSAQFATSNCRNVTIAREAVYEASVTFTVAEVAAVATMNIPSNDSVNNPLPVPLNGTGGINYNVVLDCGSSCLTFTSGDDAPWFGQDSNSYLGNSAARSGAITHIQNSWIETTFTITEAAVLSFYWRVSSEENYDYLQLFVDTSEPNPPDQLISGEIDWTLVTIPISIGTHTVRWQYGKDGSVSNYDDAGWLDMVCLSSCPANFYPDSDGDGYGDAAAAAVPGCTPPAGHVGNNADCDDTDATTHPGATEICGDGIDNNCDGNIDEDCILREPLPDTGQYRCYDNLDPMSCCPAPGEDFHGQDAQYQRSRSYTKLATGGSGLLDTATDWAMVRDNVTGLIWEVKHPGIDSNPNYAVPNDVNNIYTWYDHNDLFNQGVQGDGTTTFDTELFIAALNTAAYGGFSDWRMPTIKELSSITDCSRYHPAITSEFFPQTAADNPSYYWSSNSFVNDPNGAWVAYTYHGNVTTNVKTNNLYARAVRSEQSQSLESLVDNLDGTVTDPNTGLMWQQAEVGPMTWQAALSSCETLVLGSENYSDWRLPDVYELASLLDYSLYNPAIDQTCFPGGGSNYCWTSTTSVWSSFVPLWDNAWYVDLPRGIISGHGDPKTDTHYVHAVRTVQFGAPGIANISVTPPALDFGTICVGTTAPLYIEISNSGDADLVIGDLTISGAGSSQYSIDRCCSQMILRPGSQIQAGVVFAPTVIGAATADLEIPSNDSGTPFLVSLQGSATGDTYYIDSDNDSYGDPNPALSIQICDPITPTGYATNNLDCDDTNSTIFPGAVELCDGVDNNCDGTIDEGCAGNTYYRDADGDGYGDLGNTQTGSTPPSGYVDNSDDCNDNDPLEHPGQTWYADLDDDGFSDADTVAAPHLTQCLRPPGYKVAAELVEIDTDDDDSDNTVYPCAPELCDGKDNNQNGVIDDNCFDSLLSPLPDTGQTQSYSDSSTIADPVLGSPFYGQDSSYTRRHTYTKLAADGRDLDDSAQEWFTVRDDTSGLIWEVKHNADGVQDFLDPNDADNRYTWFDSNPATNGGKAGTPHPDTGTDTESFINALNASCYGGCCKWRLATVKELAGLVHRGINSPAINDEYFPLTQLQPTSAYWSSTPYAYSTENRAWHIYFGYGYVGDGLTSALCYVRAVH